MWLVTGQDVLFLMGPDVSLSQGGMVLGGGVEGWQLGCGVAAAVWWRGVAFIGDMSRARCACSGSSMESVQGVWGACIGDVSRTGSVNRGVSNPCRERRVGGCRS